MYGLLAIKLPCTMSPPCAPVVSLNVSTVCQLAGGASVGNDDFGIGAMVGCVVAVGTATVGVTVGVKAEEVAGAGVDGPNSDVFGRAVAAPHAAIRLLASRSATTTSQRARRDQGDATDDIKIFLTAACPSSQRAFATAPLAPPLLAGEGAGGEVAGPCAYFSRLSSTSKSGRLSDHHVCASRRKSTPRVMTSSNASRLASAG